MPYKFKTKPFAHQKKVFLVSRDKTYYGLLMEQGTGKSKVIIDTAAYLFMKGEINACLIIAPNGVHLNWILNEIPIHIPDSTPYRMASWSSMMLKKQKDVYNELWDDSFDGLRFLTMNIEAFSAGSKKAIVVARNFVGGYDTMTVIDEAHKIKKPGAKRTKSIMTLNKLSKYRRVLTGTMITKGPLDAYTQMRFLDESILGFSNFYSFRARYCEMEEHINEQNGKRFKLVTRYKNVEELTKNISRHTYRVLKSECLDLPDKIYVRRYVELGKKQKHYYNEMKQRLLVELMNDECTAAITLTKLLRLQQITGGFLPVDSGKVYAIEDNKRIQCVMDILNSCEGKVIIWARFRDEIAGLVSQIEKEYGKGYCVQYHGGVAKNKRPAIIDAFQNDDLPKIFIANQQTGGTGITLHAARDVIYYSNDFSLELRLQSEDRAHRIGLKHNVTYYDIEARSTLDTKIIKALKDKKEISDIIMSDPISNWL